MEVIRVGIAGTGRVAERFAQMLLEEEGAAISCVYNPHIDSAARFAEKFGIGVYTDDLETFSKEAEAFYIAAPHENHEPIARFLLERGGHVLCEKPLCFSGEKARELFKLADSKGLILMEAVKTAYCPGFKALVQIAKSGRIGRIRDVEACFTRLTPTNLREMTDRVYGGSFTELGTYALLPIVKLMGTGYQGLSFQRLPGVTGVDIYTKAFFDYGDQGMALAKTGLGVKSEGQLVVAGTKGYILAPSPWWLTKKFQVRYEDPGRIEEYEYPYEGGGFQYEFREFAGRVRRLEDGSCRAGKGGGDEYLAAGRESVRADAGGSFGSDSSRTETGMGEVPLSAGESAAMAGVMERFLVERREDLERPGREEGQAGIGRKAWAGTGFAGICSEGYEEPAFAKSFSGDHGETAFVKPLSGAHPETGKDGGGDLSRLRIWAHRGCSAELPENTLEAFERAAKLEGLTGIEFDVQFTKDGRLAVIHDEDIKRTTDGVGLVKDFTWEELAGKKIFLPDGNATRIPLLEEVLDLLEPYCRERGLLLNIELKTGKIRYEGIEEETVRMVRRFALEPFVVYSSFLPKSVGLVKKLDPEAKTGILASSMEDCIRLAKELGADAVHPWIGGLDAALPEDMVGMPVRAWNGEEPLFGDGRKCRDLDLGRYRTFGVTDVFTNMPGRYLKNENYKNWMKGTNL